MGEYEPHITLKINYRGSVISIRLFLSEGLTWRWVAREALRLHLLSLDTNDRKSISCHSIAGIRGPNRDWLDMTKFLHTYDLKSMEYGIYELCTEGPYFMLNDNHWISIFTYLCALNSLNALICTSKRFKKLFSSNNIWQFIPFNFNIWQGCGLEGSEADMWIRMGRERGLSLANIYRLRWNSHTSSRLRLFYGHFQEISPPDYFTTFSSLLRGMRLELEIQNTIFIISDNEDSTQSTQRFMNQLHFLVPESATAFHLSRYCDPLMGNKLSMLTDIEVSPSTSRSRNHYSDPGTRVECARDYMTFLYRRLGDTRLTFVSMELEEKLKKKASDFPLALYFKLTEKAIGNIILLRHDPLNPDRMYRELQNLWSALQYSFGMRGFGQSNYTALEWEDAKEQRYRTCATPVLILLAVDWTQWVPLDSDGQAYRRSADCQNAVQVVVAEVCHMMHRITNEASTTTGVNAGTTTTGTAPPSSSLLRSWYVQPTDRAVEMNDLRSGLFSGVNWLLRAILQHQQQQQNPSIHT